MVSKDRDQRPRHAKLTPAQQRIRQLEATLSEVQCEIHGPLRRLVVDEAIAAAHALGFKGESAKTLQTAVERELRSSRDADHVLGYYDSVVDGKTEPQDARELRAVVLTIISEHLAEASANRSHLSHVAEAVRNANMLSYMDDKLGMLRRWLPAVKRAAQG